MKNYEVKKNCIFRNKVPMKKKQVYSTDIDIKTSCLEETEKVAGFVLSLDRGQLHIEQIKRKRKAVESE